MRVVDASKCKMYMKNFGEFFINQIEHAGTIILSRTDVASPEKVRQAVDLIREHNSRAALITTPIAQLDGKRDPGHHRERLRTGEGADAGGAGAQKKRSTIMSTGMITGIITATSMTERSAAAA